MHMHIMTDTCICRYLDYKHLAHSENTDKNTGIHTQADSLLTNSILSPPQIKLNILIKLNMTYLALATVHEM